jgi:DNA-binding winged helix-turn-helix (wHTH) protein
VIELYVEKIHEKAAYEVVSHRQLGDVVGRGIGQAGKASEDLRAAISELNSLMEQLGRTPDKKKWFRLAPRTGYRLNNSVAWRVAKGTIWRRDNGIWAEGSDPKTLDQNSVSQDFGDDDLGT